MEKGKVIVGMSGGVDSTAAALLLKRQGYEVIGVTLGLWKGAESGQAVKDAAWTAEKLGIRYKVLDMSKRFRGCVIEPFMESYRNGLTPNPCVVCNPLIKEQALLEMAKAEGAAYFATGHYARIDKHPETGRYAIRNSATAAKDQTYALYRLTQEQLAAMLLPLGEYTKDEVRRIAAEIDGYSAEKGESQDICFIPDGDYAGFILRESPEDGRNAEGDFVDLEGHVLGRHKGLLYYTVGQRKGLGIAFGKPMYVHSLCPETGWCFVKMKRCFAVMCGLGILRIWLRNVLKMARALWASCVMRTGRHGVRCGKQGAKCWNVCLMNRSARSRRGSRLYCMTENTLPEAGLFFRIKVTEHKENETYTV